MRRFWILVLCLALLLLPACVPEQEEESAIRALVYEPSYDLVEKLAVGETSAEHYFTIITTSKTFFWDIEFISTDESVATVQFEKMAGDIYVYYTIEAIAVGEAYVYFTADDGKVESERIHVTVTEKGEKTEPEDTAPEDAEPSMADSETAEPETETPAEDRIVYVTKTGTKYHYSKGCAGKNATEVKLSEASLAKEPCKTCVPEEEREETTETTVPDTTAEPDSETTAPESTDSTDATESKVVYVTPSGKRYHYSKSCAGKNAKETTLDEAVAAGKTPCGTCAKN